MMSEAALARTQRLMHVPRPGRVLQFVKARLHAPEIEREAVGHILSRYGLAMTQSPENLPFGWRNRNIVVHTSAGKKVLKCYRDKWPAETIAHEHSILHYLQRNDFPAPRLVSTATGKTVVEHEGDLYALFDFVEGVNFAASYLGRRQRARLAAKAGTALAGLHRRLDGFLPEGRHHLGYISYSAGRRRDLDWHFDRLRDLPLQSRRVSHPKAREHAVWLSERSDYIAERLCWLAEMLESAPLPRLVIHGDYGIHNLHFLDDGTVTVHDFELARLEWRLIDLVGVLSRLGLANSQSFMAAYQAEYPLSEEEWHHFPYVWEYYRLRGAVQYWHNHFHMGGGRLAAARERVEKADWVLQHRSKLWQLKYASDQQARERSARVMMVVRLFYPWIGGTERQAHKLARELVDQQVPVELVTGWWFRGTSQEEGLDGIPVYRNHTLWQFFDIKGMRKFGGYLYILTLIWYLWRRRHDYDVIHVHGLNYHTFAAMLAGRWLQRKVIVKLANSGWASDIKKMRQDQQLALARYMLSTALQCDRFVALNKTVVQELTAAGVPGHKIVELPNGVEVDAITPKSDYTLHLPARITFVGRLHRQKGLDTLLQAFQKLRGQHPGEAIRLQLIGDGPLREELVALAEQLGIRPHVEFHGRSDEVLAQLQQADIFVLPSRAEGLSNALLEAMSCGLPLIASDVPGNIDVVEHRKNGLLFEVDEPGALAEQLRSLLTEPNLRRRLGREARRTVERDFSLSHVADRYRTLYRDLTKGDQAS